MPQNHTKLRPFRKLLKEAIGFIRNHKKNLVLTFLPVLVVMLLGGLFMVWYRESAPLVSIAFVSLSLLVFKMMRDVLVLSGGLVCDNLPKDGEEYDPFGTYNDVLRRLPQLALVVLVQIFFLASVMALVVLVAIALFVAPFVILGIAVRVFPDLASSISVTGQSISVWMAFIAFACAFATYIVAVALVWFSPYALLLKGSTGLDALASSIMYVKGRVWSVVWRIIASSIIASIPCIIFTIPFIVLVLKYFLSHALMSFLLFHNINFLPALPTSYLLWWQIGSFAIMLLGLPMFVSLQYFLWQDVSGHVHQFEENTFLKYRRWVKVAVYSGAVIVALFVSLATVSSAYRNTHTEQSGIDLSTIGRSGIIH